MIKRSGLSASRSTGRSWWPASGRPARTGRSPTRCSRIWPNGSRSRCAGCRPEPTSQQVGVAVLEQLKATRRGRLRPLRQRLQGLRGSRRLPAGGRAADEDDRAEAAGLTSVPDGGAGRRGADGGARRLRPSRRRRRRRVAGRWPGGPATGCAVHLVVCTDGGRGTVGPGGRPRRAGEAPGRGAGRGGRTDRPGVRARCSGWPGRRARRPGRVPGRAGRLDPAAAARTWCSATTRPRSSSARTTSTTGTTGSPAGRSSTPSRRRPRCRTTSPRPARPTRWRPRTSRARSSPTCGSTCRRRSTSRWRPSSAIAASSPAGDGWAGEAVRLSGRGGGPAGRRPLRRGVPPALRLGG